MSETPKFCFKGTTGAFFRDWSCWRRKFSSYCISSIRIGISAIEPISKSSKNQRQLSVYAWPEECFQVQVRIFFVNFIVLDCGHLIPTCVFPFVPRFESTTYLLSCFLCSFGVIRNSAKKLAKVLVLENNNFQVARRVCLEFIVISLTSYIQAEKLNLGKSGDIIEDRRWKQETRLLYYKLKKYKKWQEIKFC